MNAARLSKGALPAGPAAATVAFALSSDVDTPTKWGVLSAVSHVFPALVAGDRHVLGAPIPVPPVDLRLLGVVLEVGGEVVATAAGAAGSGHPLAAVALLAEREPLRAGEIVVAEPLASVADVRPGQVLVATIGRIGSVEAVIAG